MSKSKRVTYRNAPAWIILAAVLIVYAGIMLYTRFFAPEETNSVPDGKAEINIIDVGQGDAILIRTHDGAVIIDAGPNDSENALKKYLDKKGVRDVDYAIFTHPHEDHIGGADMIMKNYNVKNVILPDAVSTYTTYERMISAIEASGAAVHRAEPGDVYTVGGLRLTVLAPIIEEDDPPSDGQNDDTLTEEKFVARLDELRTEYPDKYFWNEYNGVDAEGIAKAGLKICSGVSNADGQSCISHGYCYFGESCTCDCGYFHGTQCFGFANLMAYKIFGSYATNGYEESDVNAKSGWRYYTKVNGYYAGDVVRINGAHSIFITKVTADTVYYVDCNAYHESSPCQIAWDNSISVSELNKQLTFVVRMSGNELTGVVQSKAEEVRGLNDYSVVVRVDFGETSFLFTGDAEALSESEMLAKFGENALDCDFLKVGHHGSSSSTTDDFLRAVSPDIAAISCGKDNPYGHPHRETVKSLSRLGVEVYRTDLLGSLVFMTDGKTITTPQK